MEISATTYRSTTKSFTKIYPRNANCKQQQRNDSLKLTFFKSPNIGHKGC